MFFESALINGANQELCRRGRTGHAREKIGDERLISGNLAVGEQFEEDAAKEVVTREIESNAGCRGKPGRQIGKSELPGGRRRPGRDQQVPTSLPRQVE